MSAHAPAKIRAALRRVWPDPDTVETAQIHALHGGLNSRSFLAVASEHRYVLRLPTPGAVALLDFTTEVRAMRAAAASGIAPAVVAADMDAEILLTEYHARAWTPQMAREAVNIPRIAALLRTLHAVRVDLPAYRAELISGEYLDAIEAAGAKLSAIEHEWAAELLRLARHYDANFEATAFCHNDLFAANVLDDGANLKLVDFEYAVHSAPLLDLAGLVGMNDYTSAQRRDLLMAYFGAVNAASIESLDGAVRMVRSLAYFWARLAALRGGAANVYAELAARLRQQLQ